MAEEPIYLFDLDSTITQQEILPTIAESVGRGEEMRDLTEKCMSGGLPFRESFLSRVDLLKDVPVADVSNAIAGIPVHEEVCAFMRERKGRCFVVTGNLDVWIAGLIERIGLTGSVFCSRGIVSDGRLLGVASVIDKRLTVEQFVGPLVAVGDGSNDADMISMAEIGIGFGGVRRIAPSVLEVCTHAIYEESRLVDFLRRLS
ncbi:MULTISPECIES: HAD-IB family phosphatase [unclassified Collinsella]|uniref:HAD-IB family phosphatase n=1 Tax=unclassified Collinsella TaxID=2637548 RepID=UPI000E49D650|nr:MULTISPECIES: HAD-IB family phosphatase [unclassified Collinsella]RGT45276.1 phosphoserine phosphatase [Collinsella sp. AF18-8LB]RGT49706.1 phosphoserine phosphatase [Collinsella sp. AF18-8]RGT66072.1 phosphoserine phosphatase [Collinsella sp. AF18-33LB]